MCEPTPVSTRYSVSSSTSFSTITTSTPITVTGTASISVFVHSSCIRRQEEETNPETEISVVPKPSPTEGGRWTGGWEETNNEEEAADEDSQWGWREESGGRESITANALNVHRTTSGAKAWETSQRTGGLNAERYTRTKTGTFTPATTPIGTGFRDKGWSGGRTPSTEGSHWGWFRKHDQDGSHGRARYHDHPQVPRQLQCEEWSTTTSTSTIQGDAQTVWSTFETTATHVVTMQVALETVYASCPVSSQAMVASVETSSDALQTDTTSEAYLHHAPSTTISEMTVSSAQPTSDAMPSSIAAIDQISAAESINQGDSSTTISHSPLPYLTEPPNPLANANEPRPSPSPQTTQSQSAIPVDQANTSSTTSKGVTAGAAVGGVIGLLLILAATLFIVRQVAKRRRQQRTEELRSSWFYGGDVADPASNEKPEQREPRERLSTHLQSRFSAPSLVSRQSRSFPALPIPNFLAHPMKHVRAASGRFPNVFKDSRQSGYEAQGVSFPAWSPTHLDQLTEQARSPLMPEMTTSTASPHPAQAIEHIPFGAFPVPPPRSSDAFQGSISDTGSNRMETMIPSPHPPPRISLNGLDGGGFGWMNQNGSPHILADPLPGENQIWDPTPGVQRLGLHVVNGAPVDSYYSVYSTTSAAESRLHLDQIGRAISAPGRESIEVGSHPGVLLRTPSGSRNLVPNPTVVPNNLPAPVAPFHGVSRSRVSSGDNSSIFEYSDYDPQRASRTTHMSATTRATRNWYEQSIFGDPDNMTRDRNSRTSAISAMWDTGEHQRSRVSRGKSVRWGEVPETAVHQ